MAMVVKSGVLATSSNTNESRPELRERGVHDPWTRGVQGDVDWLHCAIGTHRRTEKESRKSRQYQ